MRSCKEKQLSCFPFYINMRQFKKKKKRKLNFQNKKIGKAKKLGAMLSIHFQETKINSYIHDH